MNDTTGGWSPASEPGKPDDPYLKGVLDALQLQNEQNAQISLMLAHHARMLARMFNASLAIVALLIAVLAHLLLSH